MLPSTTEERQTPTEFGPYERSWSRRDCIIYALGVGAGTDDLAYTTDSTRSHPQQVIPTFLINQGIGGRGFRQDWIGNPYRTVHAGHRLVIHGRIAVSGSVETTGRIVETVPKGSGRLVTVEWASHDSASRELLATNTISYFVREPSENGDSVPSAYALGRDVPDTDPDGEVAETTLLRRPCCTGVRVIPTSFTPIQRSRGPWDSKRPSCTGSARWASPPEQC